MNPRCEAFLALSLLSALFLVPTGDAGMAASAALTAIDVLSDARAPIVDSADWRPVQSDKSQRAERSAKHDVAASPPSAPADTHAASGTISDAKRKLLPGNVSPQVATQGSVDVSAGSGLTSSAGDASRGRGICVCGLDTEGQDFCFQDSACEQLTACMSSTDCGPGERCLAHNCCPPPANFACFAICAGGCVGGGECGSYQAGTPPPPNDDCVFAEDATVPSQLTASTVGATFDAAPFCFTSNTAPGVWYRVIGTGNTMRASMCTEFVDPGYDPKLSVYCGGCDVLTCVAGNDDGFCPGLPQFPSDVSWCSIAGAEYLVLVHGWQNTTGRALLDFSDDGNPFCDGRVSCLAGDDCDDASAIPSVPFTTTFDNSTALPGSPPGSCNSGAATAMDNDVWYTYTARNDCELSVNVNPGVGGRVRRARGGV